jgi:hypothetical protein
LKDLRFDFLTILLIVFEHLTIFTQNNNRIKEINSALGFSSATADHSVVIAKRRANVLFLFIRSREVEK